MKYFQVTYADDNDYAPYGVAYIETSVDTFHLPVSGTEIETWESLSMELKDGKYADYLANDFGARLCSEKLKEVLENYCSQNDRLQWFGVSVFDANQHHKNYYILHFPENYPVVNLRKSIMAGDMVVKPVLDMNVVKNHNIFTLPGEPGRTLFVTELVKNAIEENNLSGLEFAKVPAVE